MKANLFALIVVVACNRVEKAKSDPEPTKANPQASCFADELGSLTPTWSRIDGCTADDVACRDACTHGDANACFNRAHALEESESTAHQAAALFKQGCKLGSALSCTNWAAGEWFHGETAWRCVYRVFDKSCAAKESLACGMTARMLIQEGKTPADIAHAHEILEHACTEYSGGPCRMLAYYIENATFGAPDKARISALMKQACDGGDVDACGEHKTVNETFR